MRGKKAASAVSDRRDSEQEHTVHGSDVKDRGVRVCRVCERSHKRPRATTDVFHPTQYV